MLKMNAECRAFKFKNQRAKRLKQVAILRQKLMRVNIFPFWHKIGK